MPPVSHFINAAPTNAQGVPNRAARRSRRGRPTRRTLMGHALRFGTTSAVVAAGGVSMFFVGVTESNAATVSTTALTNAKSGQVLSQNQAISDGFFTRQVSAAPDGSTTYTYKYANGLTATEVVPPPGFHPLTASDAELQKYGFPPRPTTATQLASWTKGMAAYTGKVIPNLSVKVVTSDVNTGAATAASEGKTSPSAITGGNWGVTSPERPHMTSRGQKLTSRRPTWAPRASQALVWRSGPASEAMTVVG
jgi:hypothetical protein